MSAALPTQAASPGLDALRTAGIDFDAAPLDFLTAYPYPAIVVVPGVPINGESHSCQFSLANIQPLSPVWTNPCWRRLAGSRKSLLECLTLENVRRISLWLSGAMDPVDSPAPTITLEFSFGPIKTRLMLAKTTFPIFQTSEGKRVPVDTHILAVVTAIPQGALGVLPAGPMERSMKPPSRTPGMSSSGSTSSGSSTSAEPITPGLAEGADAFPFPGQHKKRPSDPGVPSNMTGQPLLVHPDGSVQLHHHRMNPLITSGHIQQLFRSTNWAETPLGPYDQWPEAFKILACLVMKNPEPAAVWVGKDLTMIYNAYYAETLPNHPRVFGKSGTEAWAEIWPSLGPLSELALRDTPIVKKDDFFLSNDLKETYRTHQWVPIPAESGAPALLHSMVDTTDKVVAERRSKLLQTVSDETASCQNVQDFDDALLQALGENPQDVPFAMLYHVDPPTTRPKPRKTMNDRVELRLRYAGGVGVPEGHSSAPASLSVAVLSTAVENKDYSALRYPRPGSVASFRSRNHSVSSSTIPSRPDSPVSYEDRPRRDPEPWPFTEAIQTRQPVHVQDCSATIEGYTVRAWDELPTGAIIVPIHREDDAGVAGAVLVLGLNCRQAYDAAYVAFLQELRTNIATPFVAARLLEAEAKRKEEVAAMSRAKHQLFSGVSHELFTPLSLISGPLDDTLADLPSSAHRDALEIAQRNVYRLTRLLTLLMEMSGNESGSLKGAFSLVNLGEVTRNIAGLFRKSFENPDLEYTVDCDTAPRDVFVDREKYERILFYLIGNALRFTPSGSIKVSLHYEDDEAMLTVEDTGKGMPQKDLERLLEAFREGDDPTAMALSYTKRLVQFHHGTLYMDSVTEDESEDGSHGSSFSVALPLGSDHLPQLSVDNKSLTDDVSDASLRQLHQSVADDIAHCHYGWVRSTAQLDPHPPTGYSVARSGRGIDPSTLYFTPEDVVLIVDDLADTRAYMRSILEPLCAVIEAKDGEEAMEMMKDMVTDLVIADVVLPKMSGFDLITALRTGKREQQTVPVILLTARDDTRGEAVYGPDDYLPKPFNARDLIARAHMQLQLGKKRRALEAAFEERTNELRCLTDHTPVGIFRTTEDGWVVYANQAWYDISGYPTGVPIINWGDYIVEEHRARIRDIWTNFLATGQQRAEGELQWVSGRWVVVIALRLKTIVGAPPGILGCLIDITDRIAKEDLQKRQTAESERQRQEAEEARRQQEELIDITSHEIRNPISSLMQCSSLVKSNLISLLNTLQTKDMGKDVLHTITEDIDALESIYQCGLTQERISNDVLSLGKIQLGKLDVHKEAQKLVSIFQGDARMNGVTLTLHMSRHFKRLGITSIMIDHVRFGQIVSNLLSNAIRFTSNSPVRRVVFELDIGRQPPASGSFVKPDEHPDTVVLDRSAPLYLFGTVSDTGPGLTPTELETVFHRFSQASAKTHTVFGGTGLGLFVCRKITSRMDGGIGVTSEYGHGSTFNFWVKAAPVPEPSPSPSPPQGAPEVEKYRARVLIVEDNVINRKVLTRQLKQAGLDVESVTNGLEGLEKLRATQKVGAKGWFDCVLMDLEMPIMDGYTATRTVREDEARGDLRKSCIIALTGNARHAQIDEHMVGFDDIVVKPYQLDKLLARIKDTMVLGQ